MRDCELERKHKHPDEEMKDEVNQSAKANELQKTIKSLEFKIDEYEKRQDDLLSDMFTWTGWNKRLLIIYLYWN